MEVTEHSDYARFHSEHVSQRAVAEAAHDEVGMAKADKMWSERQLEMYQSLASQQQAKDARNSKILELKTQFPHVPEGVYAHIPDLEIMEKTVREAAALIPTGKEAPVTARAPIAPAGDSSRAPAKDKYNDDAYLKDLSRRARAGDQESQEEIKRQAFFGADGIAEKFRRVQAAKEEGRRKTGSAK